MQLERFWKVTAFIVISMLIGMLALDPALAGGGGEGGGTNNEVIIDTRARADFRVDNNNGRRNSLRAKFLLSNSMLLQDPRCPSVAQLDTYAWTTYPSSSFPLDCQNWQRTGNGFRYRASRGGTGGVYSIRLRNSRHGLKVDIRARGNQYYSGVNLNSQEVQVNLVVGDQNLCGRFTAGTMPNRGERNGLTTVRFKGSSACIEQPDIKVLPFLQYNQTVVGGATGVDIHKFVVRGDPDDYTWLEYASVEFNPDSVGKLSNLRLWSQFVNYATTSLVDYFTSVWPNYGVEVGPGGFVREFNLKVDTQPAWSGPYVIQTTIPSNGVGVRNEKYWRTNGPQEELVGPRIDVVENGLLHADFVKLGDAYKLGFSSEFERFQVLAAAVRGYGFCSGTQVVVYMNGSYTIVPFEEIDDQDWYVGNIYATPGSIVHAVTYIPEPGCQLQFVRAPGIGQTSAALHNAQPCLTIDGSCSTGEGRTFKDCVTHPGQCWTCPTWIVGHPEMHGNSDYCVRAPDPL